MRYIYVGGTPETDRQALTAIRGRVAGEFGAAVREMELPGVEFAFDAGRGQYGSIPVLEMLNRLCPDDALKFLAVTERDLFIPVLTFVFGQAQLGGRVGVVSLARLRQEFYGLARNDAVLLERAHKEVLHETGHLFGLVHCADRRCAMSLATGVRQIDEKDAAFCEPCSAHKR
jgi:archaemetzincin